MAVVLQAYELAQQHILPWIVHVPKKTDGALKIGVLSLPSIGTTEIIHPVSTHPEVVLYAIASGDPASASMLAAKHGFQISHGSYDALVADPEIDFVYISLPTALHFEWASKCLEAGKHVLLEPPFTSNAVEARTLVRKAETCNRALMEGCHWQFHPASHRFRQILDSGVYGGIVGTSAGMSSTPAIPKDDVRWTYELSGGSLLAMGSVVGFTRFILHAGMPDAVLHAQASASEDHDPRVDSSMIAMLRFKARNINPEADDSDVYSTIYTDMERAPAYGVIPRVWELPSIRAETEGFEIYFYNALMPHAYHYMGITEKSTGKTTYEYCFKGGPLWNERGGRLWSSYRYQLEAFVDKLKGRKPVWWIAGEDSVQQMKTIDRVYRESGLPLRPMSDMV